MINEGWKAYFELGNNSKSIDFWVWEKKETLV
jgi:hypothetical protein